METLNPKAVYYFWYSKFRLPFFPFLVLIAITQVLFLPRNILKILLGLMGAVIFMIFLGSSLPDALFALIMLFKVMGNQLLENILSIPIWIPLTLTVALPFWIGITYFWANLWYRCYGYEFTEKDVRIEKGIVKKTFLTVPYTKIQNAEISRNIIARVLGLSELRIYTAAGIIEIPGLSQAVAENLRSNIMGKIKTR